MICLRSIEAIFPFPLSCESCAALLDVLNSLKLG